MRDDVSFSTKVLIVDDDDLTQKTHQSVLKEIEESDGRALDILVAKNLDEAREYFRSGIRIHVCLLDKHLGTDESAENGVQAIPDFLQMQPQLKVVVITGDPDHEEAVTALKRFGASDYLSKDIAREKKIRKIRDAIREAKDSLIEYNRKNSHQPRAADNEKVEFVGNSLEIQLHKERLVSVARTKSTVLITGKPGTGKTTSAYYIRELLQEKLGKDMPFIDLNMGAIPKNLIESELFGHAKGAFTGAIHDKKGKLVLANGGVLFCDEIGEAPLDLQAKLLKVLETQEVTPVGGEQKVRKVDVKFIFATNRDLPAMVERGEFRKDLLARINVLPIEVPSLEQIAEDIPVITKNVFEFHKKKAGLPADLELPKSFIEFVEENLPEEEVRGIMTFIERLVTYAPREKDNRPYLEGWESKRSLILGKTRVVRRRHFPKSGKVSVDEIVSRGLQLPKGSASFDTVMSVFESELLKAAASQARTGLEVASSLKLDKSKAGRLLRQHNIAPALSKQARSLGESNVIQ